MKILHLWGFVFRLVVIMVVSVACVHGDAFERKIRAMSDSDLVSYYQGLNDRIKDIENKQILERSSRETEHERMVSQSTFIISGEGHDLVEKQKAAYREIRRRNLSPE
jgi:hypothetical protein